MSRPGNAQDCTTPEQDLHWAGVELACPVHGLDNLWFGVPLRMERFRQGDTPVAETQTQEVLVVRSPLPEAGVAFAGRCDEIG